MKKLSYPTILCNSFEVAESGEITGFKMRIERSKLTMVRALQSIGHETATSGNSYNNLGMIEVNETDPLFRTTEEIKKTYLQYPVFETYAGLLAAIKAAQRRDEQRTVSRKEAVFSCAGDRSVRTFTATGGEEIRMTEAIFDRDPWELCFMAEVFSLTGRMTDGETCFAVILDWTVFFPRQGGQKTDRGTPGGIKIPDITIRDGIITHLVNVPLSIGSMAAGTIDRAYRFDFMQQYTGEHMLSGLVHRFFGAENVGFHLSEHEVQADLGVPLSAAGLAKLENAVNEAVFRNILVRAFYPDMAEFAAIFYRQKEELTRAIRLVEIGDADTCAYCASYVARNSEVGLTKILNAMNYKGGTKPYLVYGMRALTAFSACLNEAKEISARLSAPPGKLGSAVMEVQEKSTATGSRTASFTIELVLARTETAA